jgi:hypothetical protein
MQYSSYVSPILFIHKRRFAVNELYLGKINAFLEAYWVSRIE